MYDVSGIGRGVCYEWMMQLMGLEKGALSSFRRTPRELAGTYTKWAHAWISAVL